MSIFALFFRFCYLPVSAAPRAQAVDDNIVIVIDPGHGGENRGADEYGEPIEKDMTLVTALAMRDELSKYDNVTVFLTRTDDRDMELEERAQFAQDVGADFLFSLHYNACESHKRFGSEILLSLTPPFNAYGFQFGQIELAALEEKGFYNRGIKAKKGNSGDYYGLLRECSARQIPSVIIEHCYVDNPKDRDRCDSEVEQQSFGVLDATCVAKYFGLRSSQLGVDYSSMASEMIEVTPGGIQYPTICNEDGIDELTITQEDVDIYTGDVTIGVHGFDKNESIIYYEYSINGGETYTDYFEWPGADPLRNENDGDFTVQITLGTGSSNPITFRAYNQFDEDITSNTINIDWNKDRLNGDGTIASEETPGQWINNSGMGTVTGDGVNTADISGMDGVTGSDDAAVTSESGEVNDKPKKSQDTIFVKHGQLTWVAILVVVAPFIIGILLAGIFIHRNLK